MDFKKYQHVERYGNTEVNGIELGTVYVFPKIDGTNGSLWWNDGLCAGSRNRELIIWLDNAGFYTASMKRNYHVYFKEYPNHRLFGEWLVPHSLKTYKEKAWKKFYVFDVAIDKNPEEILHEGDDTLKYLPYDEYKPLLETCSIDYIPPIAILNNATYANFVEQLEKNVFLIEDGEGYGEGIVLKNYDFKNKYNRQVWAKIVTSEFKEKHSKVKGAPQVNYKDMIEKDIANEFVTKALCEKVKAKIENEKQGFNSSNIPQLLNTVFYDLIVEESWQFLKEHKFPTINFKTLKHFSFSKVKKMMPELF